MRPRPDSRHERAIVGAVPAGVDATVEYADGTTEPLPVDPDTWIATWTGRVDHAPRRIHVGAHACRIDGHDGFSGLDFGNGGAEGAFDEMIRNGDLGCIGAAPRPTGAP